MDITPKVFKNDYETTFITAPEMTEAEHKEVVEKYLNLLRSNDAEIINIEHWGLRKLAYPIDAKNNGYYTYVEFTAYGTLVSKLEKEYGYDERILRYLTVRLDKHAVAYNNKRREQGFGMRKNAETSK
jgi:small subunit ribosomal protein S6